MIGSRIFAASLTVFLAACGGGGGGSSGGEPLAPTVTLTVSPQTVDSGESATLTWSSTDATECTASGSWSGARGMSGSQGTGALTGNASYTLTCTGTGGSDAETASVTVNPVVGAPTINLAANPSNVLAGAASTLTWSTANATSCTASSGWSGSKGTSGSTSTGNLGATTGYTLTCDGPGGSASQTVTVAVTVVPAPSVSLSASPTSLASGSASTLTWTATNATTCTASDGWSGSKNTAGGTASTGALSATTTFMLSCSGTGGTASNSTTVTVVPAPTVSLSANPTSLASGLASTLSWSATNATSCTASGGWSGSKNTTSGTASTGVLSVTTSFTLSCSGTGGTASDSATVTVIPAPTVSLNASPTSLASGSSSTLTWSSTNATSCTASGGWSGTKAASGTLTTGALTTTTTYTLSCSGLAGSASDAVTVTVTGGGSSPFPLSVQAGKRYLVTAQGSPFLMHGDTPWCLITQLTREEVDEYLEDRRAKGFNSILVELIESFFSTNAPANVYGEAPFLVAGDFSTPNEAYFSHAEYVIAKAREKGMLVLITPAYLGFSGGIQGWYDAMGAAGSAVMKDYGRYVATRFEDYDNILWVHGGDYNPPDRDPMRAIVEGLLEIETTRLHTFHGSRGTAALEWLGASETWLDVNNIYGDTETVIAEAEGEYARSTMPFFLIEGDYEDEGADPTETRQQAWQAVLSGATGQLMGQKQIWRFTPDFWQSRLDTEGASTMVHLRSLMESYAWWTLVPDFANTFLTAGIGTGGARAPAAVAADGSFAFIYTRDVRNLTVDLGDLTGSEVQARWYDPTNGTFATIAGSPFAASGSQVFRPTGNNSRNKTDWVLVLDAVP